MNPQTQAEATRILDVVDDLVTDLETLACFPTTKTSLPTRDMEYIVNSFVDESAAQAQEQIEAHLSAEPRLDKQVSRPGLVVASSTGAMVEDGPLNPEEIESLHLSTRSLVDTLRACGFNHGYQPSTPASGPVNNFVTVIQALRGLLQGRFETTVEEDVVKFAILNDTVNRADAASADVSALNRDLHQSRESRRVEVERRDLLINRLESDIAAVHRMSDNERNNTNRSAEERREADKQQARQQLEALEEQTNGMLAELAELEKKCWAEETAFRKARTSKEMQLMQTIGSYDEEMQQATDQLRDLRVQITSDKDEYEQVHAQVEQLEAEAEIHAQELALEEDRKAQTAAIAANRHIHARMIQAFFRSHMTRVRAAMKNKRRRRRRG